MNYNKTKDYSKYKPFLVEETKDGYILRSSYYDKRLEETISIVKKLTKKQYKTLQNRSLEIHKEMWSQVE